MSRYYEWHFVGRQRDCHQESGHHLLVGGFYLDVIKDRQYTTHGDSLAPDWTSSALGNAAMLRC